MENECLRSDYEALWTGSRDRLAAGLVEPDPVPEEAAERWGLSAVLRPAHGAGDGVAGVLAAVAGDLARLAGERHVVYDASDLHTTLRTLEFYRRGVEVRDSGLRRYVEALEEVCGRYAPISVAYEGLTASAMGVLAQGWPVSEDLQGLREALREELDLRGLLDGPEVARQRRTAHASLIVFAGPLRDPSSLVRYVEANRHTSYGVATVPFVDLVRWDRAPFGVRLVLLARVALMKR